MEVGTCLRIIADGGMQNAIFYFSADPLDYRTTQVVWHFHQKGAESRICIHVVQW